MTGKEKCLRFLKKVIQESSADQTEALLLTEDSSLTRFSRSTVHQHVAERNRTLILRVVLGKRIAVVTTNSWQPDSVKPLLQKAIAMARVLPPNEQFRSLPGPKPLPEMNTYCSTVDRLTPDRKVKIIKDLIKRMKPKGLKVSGAFSNGVVESAVVNSLGVEAYQLYSDLVLHFISEGEKNTGYAHFVGRDPEQLNLEELAEEAARKVTDQEPVQIEPGEYEVILEPLAVSELLDFLSFLGLHALALQEDRSFLCGFLGKKMLNERVTLYDDGLDPAGLQIPFDFEGVPKQKVTFFENGVARGVTYDSLTAGREGKESTGHGLISPNTAGPVPINLIMKEGTSTLDDMVKSVRRGIYVTRFHYTNVVEPMKAVVTGMTRDGTFLIEDGEIRRPVNNLRFTESVLKALSRVSAVSKERKICTEGTVYSRRFITGTVAPAIKVDGFNFSGVSAL
jgi:PmbA protein